MRKFVTRAIVIALIGSTGILMTGCYGSFRLTSKLHDWNGSVSSSKFVNELVFLGLCIIPAYEICVLGDGLIFNSIEWWGGSNPIAMKDGQREESKIVHKGQDYKMVKTRNHVTIALENSDLSVDFKYFPEEKAWFQMDGENRVKVVELKGKKVLAYLPNRKALAFDENSVGLVESEVSRAYAME